MSVEKDIAEYYDTTQIHYTKWWNLDKYLSLHYGIWHEDTKTFGEALVNTNKLLSEVANISESDKVLDAGCGVGGAAFFVNEQKKAKVVGISLSPKQVSTAKKVAQSRGLEEEVEFHIMDFTKTTYADESFDVVWACESVCHAPDKRKFIEESFRLLKKGGRLVLFDFFLADENQEDKNNWIDKWKSTWAIQRFASNESFLQNLNSAGFSKVKSWDYTAQIKKSARRMYYASILAAVPSEAYNLLHPKVSRFAKTHYKCGYYQYKALNEGLWKYTLFLAEK